MNNKNLQNDDELIDYILKEENIREHFEGMTAASTKEDFKALSNDRKTKGIKNYYEEQIKKAISYYGIPSTLDLFDNCGVKQVGEF